MLTFDQTNLFETLEIDSEIEFEVELKPYWLPAEPDVGIMSSYCEDWTFHSCGFICETKFSNWLAPQINADPNLIEKIILDQSRSLIREADPHD